MKKFIIDFIIDLVAVAILSIVAFFMLHDIVGVVGKEVLCSISVIIGLTWWLICLNQKELMDEIKDLRKEIKELKEKKNVENTY